MSFDWQGFLTRNSIPFITEGKNVRKGNLNTKCPICQGADPSEHLGIDPKTGFWSCWRNSAHRGKSPQRLIVAYIRCTWAEAERIAGEDQTSTAQFDLLGEQVKTLFTSPKVKPVSFQPLKLPEEFRPITEDTWHGRFWEYLTEDRGFHPNEVQEIINRYSVRGCTSGSFRQRIIIPFQFEGKIVGWTGRAIGNATLRYLSYPNSGAIKNIVYNYDRAIEGGPTLVITEGPLDCIKTDFYGGEFGITAVATLGISLTPQQLVVLARLSRRFDKVVSLLDDDALAQSVRLSGQLARPVHVVNLPPRVKDPGELSRQQAADFFSSPLFF